MLNIEQLNSDFSIAGQLKFVKGPGGFPMIAIDNDVAKALISIYGGQVLSFQPADESEDLLFLSQQAYYKKGKAIKGGIPICWPWFGPDPENKGRPAHGFVRNRHWDAVTTRALTDGSILVRIGSVDSHQTQAVWPHRFQLSVEINVGPRLNVALVTRNSGDDIVEITQALHTYFRIGDVNKVNVFGLEGKQYIDKVDAGAEKTQSGPVTINGEVDRIYSGVRNELVIEDNALERRIRITCENSKTSVVWNPWSEISTAMDDLADDDYKRMLCVETANAGPDKIGLPPGGACRLVAQYAVERD